MPCVEREHRVQEGETDSTGDITMEKRGGNDAWFLSYIRKEASGKTRCSTSYLVEMQIARTHYHWSLLRSGPDSWLGGRAKR